MTKDIVLMFVSPMVHIEHHKFRMQILNWIIRITPMIKESKKKGKQSIPKSMI